jgi:hypothetical protein
MKAILKTPFADFELQAEKPTDMFKAIAEAQEVFTQRCCGLCKKTDIKLVVRNVKGNDFYEMHCQSCFGKLAFGQSKQMPGKLFPIRKLIDSGDEKGKPSRKLGKFDTPENRHNGWTKYKGEPVKDDE